MALGILLKLWIVLFVFVDVSRSLIWDEVRCSTDIDQNLKSGKITDIGRFPWLGVIQHHFELGGQTRFAVTTAILIHPSYVIAAAEDMARIPHEIVTNTTKFIAWHSADRKYVIEVLDYVLHPEYEKKVTRATVALVQLITYGETGMGGNSYPVLPICMPLRGIGLFDRDVYAAKLTDETKEVRKVAFKMQYVDSKECNKFYRANGLASPMMMPTSMNCMRVMNDSSLCSWDYGSALITRQSWGHWVLLGFGIRGPGCGAPARFLSVAELLPWVTERAAPTLDDDADFVFEARRFSPIKVKIFPASKIINKETGQCGRRDRGAVLYRDSLEVTMNKNFGQGFFFLVIHELAAVTCVIVHLVEFTAKSNAAVWLEHSCHQEVSGEAKAHNVMRDYRRLRCFMYFKSAAFVHFRFYFSFKTVIDVSIFGRREVPPRMPTPFHRRENTESWWPTNKIIEWGVWYAFPWWKTIWG